MATCRKEHLWGYPDPTGSRPLGCPGPRGCGGPRWGLVARLWSSQNQSSRPQFCRSSHAQTAGNCPQPAGNPLKIRFCHKTKGVYFTVFSKFTLPSKHEHQSLKRITGTGVSVFLSDDLIVHSLSNRSQNISWNNSLSSDKIWNVKWIDISVHLLLSAEVNNLSVSQYVCTTLSSFCILYYTV